MPAILKQFEFWIMIAAMMAHSLSTTSWSSYSLLAWALGMLLIWALYGVCRLEAHRKEAHDRLSQLFNGNLHLHSFWRSGSNDRNTETH